MSVESSETATSTTRRGGVTGKGFTPGRSGNPGGRVKGFAARIKDLCGEDYGKIVEGYCPHRVRAPSGPHEVLRRESHGDGARSDPCADRIARQRTRPADAIGGDRAGLYADVRRELYAVGVAAGGS